MAEVDGGNKLAVDDGVEKHAPAEVTAPVIVALGKKKRRVIKRLKRGKGPAMDEVMEVLEQVQDKLGSQAEGKILVPVVIIYKEKQKRFRGFFR
jgi:hypothetical protein